MGTITETQCINRHHQAIVIEALTQATDHRLTAIDHRLTAINHLTTLTAISTTITENQCINRHHQAIVIEALNQATDNQVIVIEALTEATDDRLTDIDHRLKVIDHQTIAIEAPTMVEATDHRLTVIEAVITDTMHDQTTIQVAIEEIATVQVIETIMLHHTVDRALIQVRYLINQILEFQKLKLVKEHTEVMKLMQALNKEVLKLVKVS